MANGNKLVQRNSVATTGGRRGRTFPAVGASAGVTPQSTFGQCCGILKEAASLSACSRCGCASSTTRTSVGIASPVPSHMKSTSCTANPNREMRMTRRDKTRTSPASYPIQSDLNTTSACHKPFNHSILQDLPSAYGQFTNSNHITKRSNAVSTTHHSEFVHRHGVRNSPSDTDPSFFKIDSSTVSITKKTALRTLFSSSTNTFERNSRPHVH